MITWIQKTFQQHFRIIFLVLLAGVIISFIFITNTSGGFGRGDYKAPKRPFFGHDLSNEQDFSRIQQDGNVSAMLLGVRGDVQQHAFGRCAWLALADNLHLPQPSDAELKTNIQSIPAFMNYRNETQTPYFDAALYNNIRTEPARYGIAATPGSFRRILSEDARIAAVAKLVAGPGYVQPSEVQQHLKQADSTWTLQTATIDRAAFKPAITPTELELTAYFDTNRARYTIPPRVRVSYAEVSAALYMPRITVTDQEVRDYYNANPSRFPKPAAAPATMAAPASPDNDFAQVKPQVELALRQQKALQAANKTASDLAYKLYADKVTPGSPEFTRLLIQNNATINAAPEFSEDDVPAQFGLNRYGIAKEAFSLDATNRISNAVNTGAGAVILFWENSTPSREPSFLEVRDKVNEDYTTQRTQEQFIALGQKLKTQIQAAIKTGSTFEQAATKAATNSGLTATTKTIPAFTLRTATAADIDMNIATALESLNKGDVSDMSIVETNGRFLYVQDLKLPDLTEANPEYARIAAGLANQNAAITASQYIKAAVDAEQAKTAPVNH